MVAAGIGLLLFGTLVLAIVQISIFRSLPNGIRKLMCVNTFMGMVCNFLLSTCILFFTGIGNLVGFLNVAASVLVAFYIEAYRRKHGIEAKVLWKWKVIPVLVIEERNPSSNWLF